MRLSQDPVDSGIKLSVSLAVGYLEDFYVVMSCSVYFVGKKKKIPNTIRGSDIPIK